MIKQKAKLLISFVPRICLAPINAGSEEAKKKIKNNLKIINVFGKE